MSDTNQNKKHFPQTLLPAQLGSVVHHDGRVSGNSALTLEHLGDTLNTRVQNTSNIQIHGNSHFDSSASSWSLAVSGGAAYSSVSVSGFFDMSKSTAQSGQTIDLKASFFGTNRIARIQFDGLSPNEFIKCLSRPMLATDDNQKITSEYGKLANVIKKIIDLKPDTNISEDLLKELTQAQAAFDREYGMGFVSGVVLGGAATVNCQINDTSKSNDLRWAAGLTVAAGNGKTFGGHLGVSFGKESKNAFKDASFSVSSYHLGSKSYADFAAAYRKQFENKGLSKLFDTSVAAIPVTTSLVGKIPKALPFVKRPSVPSITKQFGKIKTPQQLDLFYKAKAYENYRKNTQNPVSYERWAADQENNDNQINNGQPLPNNEPERENLPNNLLLGDKPKPEPTKKDDPTNQSSWSILKEDYEVLGVQITRWRDVIPALGQIDTLLNEQKKLQNIANIHATIKVFQEISDMYALAAACMHDNDLRIDFLVYSDRFQEYKLKLAKKIFKAKTIELGINNFLKNNLKANDNKIYGAFCQYREIFTLGEVGYGGSIYYSDFEHYRVGYCDRKSTNTADGSTWFTAKLSKTGTASNNFNARYYKDAIKWFPILSPSSIEESISLNGTKKYSGSIYLCVSDPSIPINSALMVHESQFFGNEKKYLWKIDLKHVALKDEACNEVAENKKAIRITMPENETFERFRWSDSLYTFGRYLEDKPASKALLKDWHYEDGKRGKYLWLFPFTQKEVQKLDWKGFVAYPTKESDDLLDTLNAKFKSSAKDWKKGIQADYWADRGYIDETERYRNETLKIYQAYLGYVDKPLDW